MGDFSSNATHTIQALLQAGREDRAIEIVLLAASKIRKAADWLSLKILLETQFHPQLRFGHPILAPLYARALVGCYELSGLEDFLRQALAQHRNNAAISAKLQLEQAFLKIVATAYVAAVKQLNQILPQLLGIDKGLGLARLGMAKSSLGHSDWLLPFIEMRQYLSGRVLGIQLVNEAAQHSQHGDSKKAQDVIQEALPYLVQDTYSYANAQTTLGLTYLKQCSPKALEHFQIAERMTRSKQYQKLHAHIIKCMAAHARVFSDWERALELYKRVIAVASKTASADLAARDEALLNTGRTLRLQGKPHLALGYLEQTLLYYPLGQSGVLVEQAAAYLQLGNIATAKALLQAATQPRAEDKLLKHILSAEALRQQGNLSAMLGELAQVDMTSALAREEATQWQALWEAAAAHGLVVPQPIFVPRKVVVHLQNLGVPKVLWKNQEIHLTPRCLELLALLSWHDGIYPVQDCVIALYGSLEPENLDKFEQVLKGVRKAFALRTVVVRYKKNLQLLNQLLWIDDAKRVLDGKKVQKRGVYLQGQKREWIMKVRSLLETHF